MNDRRPLRVCMLMGRYLPDFTGHGIQIRRLLPYLERHGVEATVVTRRPAAGLSWQDEDDPAVKRILPLGSGPLKRLRGPLRLRAHFHANRHRYDVVHAAFTGWDLYLNLPYLSRIGLPLLFEMILLGADDPVTIRGQRLGRLRLRLLERARFWVGITEAFRQLVQEAGIPEERFRCIHVGVDVDRYRPPSEEGRRALRAALGIPAEARVVVTVGALMPRKGMDRLLRAWAHLAPQPEKDLLLILGPARESDGLRAQFLPYVRALEARSRAPEVAGTVRFAGRVDDVERYMAAADVFAFLSRREGFGTVIAEAMASGLPCMVAPLDGIAHEILTQGETGYVIEEPDDAAGVAAQLARLLEDPARRRAIGAAARQAAVERFSMATRARQLVELYQRMRDGD